MQRTPTPTGRFFKLFYLWSSPAQGRLPSRASFNAAHCINQVWRPTGATLASHNTLSHRSFTTSHALQSSPPTTTPEALADQMRRLMRSVPHPVVILTATHPPPQTTSSTGGTGTRQQPEANYRGMTISSFNTVCLEPRPIISFNMKLPSRTYNALEANAGFFLIHLLTGANDGAALADSFTRGQEEVHRVLSAGLEGAGGDDNGDSGPALIRTAADKATKASPMMAVGTAVSSVLRCRLLEGMELRIEDHVVLCAEVFDIVDQQQGGGPKAADSEGLSLLYADRAFRHVGPVVDWSRQNR